MNDNNNRPPSKAAVIMACELLLQSKDDDLYPIAEHTLHTILVQRMNNVIRADLDKWKRKVAKDD
jgi:hypothetical protein